MAELVEQFGVLGILGQVVQLVWVGLKIEELLIGRSGVNISRVAVGSRAHAKRAGNAAMVTIGVIIEEVFPLCGLWILSQGTQVLPRHRGGDFKSGQREHRGGEVGRDDHPVGGLAAADAWVVEETRNPQ